MGKVMKAKFAAEKAAEAEAELAAEARAAALAKARTERSATIKGNDELWVANMPSEVVTHSSKLKFPRSDNSSLQSNLERTPILNLLTPSLMRNENYLAIELNSLNYYLSTRQTSMVY